MCLHLATIFENTWSKLIALQEKRDKSTDICGLQSLSVIGIQNMKKTG